MKETRASAVAHLPVRLRALFWDYSFAKLRWPRDRELVVNRILQSGAWEDVKWLRSEFGDAALRVWIVRRRGRGLSPQQLRYWQLVLAIPRRQVDAWLKDLARQVWDRRARA
jgi:hypothetical protein